MTITYYSNNFSTFCLQIVNDQVIYIYNIYNLYQMSSNPSLLALLRQIIADVDHKLKQIIIEDFNFNNSSWESANVYVNQKANKLILFTKKFEIE